MRKVNITFLVLIAICFNFCLYILPSYAGNSNNDFSFNFSEKDLEQMTKDLDEMNKEMDKVLKTLTANCKQYTQPSYLRHVEKIIGCKSNAIIPNGSTKYFYVIKAKEGDKCHIQKQDFLSGPNYETKIISNCYIPMSEFNKMYNFYLEYAKNMCGTDNETADYKQKKADVILMDYCK